VFRAMTWNVQNLFLAGAEDGPETQAEFDAKIASLKTVIDAQAPDVLALQEVGPLEALAALQGALTHALPHTAISDRPDGRGIRVAVLSRLEITSTVQLLDLPPGLIPPQVEDIDLGHPGAAQMDSLKRGALEVTVDAAGGPVTLITAHLKSKLLTFPGGFQPANEDERARYGGYALNRRTVEAVTLRVRLDALLQGHGQERRVLLMGDLNDEIEAATTQIFNGPGGSEIGTPGFSQPDGGDGDRMWNLAPLIPEAQRFTRIYRGRRELIDHIFASHQLLDPEPRVSTAIAAPGELPSITDDPQEQRGKPGSDHSAVIAEFDHGV